MNPIHSLVAIVSIAFSTIPCIFGACNFTSDLTGQWYSTSFGTLNFTYNKFAGFTSGISSAPLTFTCYLASGSRYVSKTSYSLFVGFNVDVYLCMDLEKVSSIKYYFTLNSDVDTSEGLRFYSPATFGANVTMDEACARTDYRSPGEYELLIKKSNISAAVSTCPSGLQSTFNVTMSTSSVSNCAGTRLVGSEDALSFNYSSCVKGSLSSFGHLRCLYSKTDTYTYVTLYDNATSASNKFTCMVYEKIEGTVRATEYPGSCQHNQTPKAVTSPGVTYVMTDLLYVASEDKKDYTVVIIVVCVIGGLIIIAIIVILVYIKVCRKPSIPESPKPKKPKRQLSVTDYHPKVLGRSLSSEKTEGVLCKQSTEEILTGVLEGKKNKSSTLNGDAYEPPKKEAWQKKWEKNPTRSNAILFQKMKQNFPSDGGISKLEELSALELDKAYTMSTSLPESLDLHSNKPSAKPKEKSPGKVPETQKNLASPKYTEKIHSSTSIPQSTGKFGGSPRIQSFDSIPLFGVEPKLDTITENPFSRENTKASLLRKGTPVHQLKETSKSPRLHIGDTLSVSTVVVSPGGTASVGDITFQNSFKNISRVSHLSASSASIFDDPGWLLDNKLNADVTFDRMQNLQASVPKPKDKDPKWFLSTPKKPEISREDMDFFRSRSKSNVGINKGKWSSLEIIAQELKRRQDAKTKKPKTVKTKFVHPKNQHSDE